MGIHAIMYTYYFVSMHTRDIWWKKYLTLAQLFQFTCMNGQALVLYATGCSDAPPRVTGLYFVYISSGSRRSGSGRRRTTASRLCASRPSEGVCGIAPI